MRLFLVLALLIALPLPALAQSALGNCADQFIGGDVANAPRVSTSAQGQPFGNNEHLCYRDDDASFFAMEYWPDHFAPRWTAYRLSRDDYGQNGCNTLTRNRGRCYFKTNTWTEFLACEKKTDPFHADHMLQGTKLATKDFQSTGHDNGHVAPRQAFSWNICATYQTFSMANMSPQKALLNQQIWADLEGLVLTWAVTDTDGPIYVVTGTVFGTFPHGSFQVYSDGVLDSDHIYPAGMTLTAAVTQHRENHQNHNGSGNLLDPLRNANPNSVRTKVANMRMPTGYFKVIYRPARGNEPAHSAAFLIPHTFEDLNSIHTHYEGYEDGQDFWAFLSTIDLVEETAGIQFPGIPDDMKSVWRDDYFWQQFTPVNIPWGPCPNGRTATAIIEGSTRDQRIAACTDLLD